MRCGPTPLASLFLSCVFLSALPTDLPNLELREPVERSIAGGQKHLYRLDLVADEFVSIALEQRDVDVVIRFQDRDGKLVAEFDTESRLRGTEMAEGVGLENGSFRLEVEPRYKDAPIGRYQIELSAKRPATENDKSLQEARILLRESRALEREGKYKDALALSERVLETRERILGADDVEVGIVLTRIGNQQFLLDDHAKSESVLRRALAIYEARLGPDHLLVGEATNNLAVLARVRGDLPAAEEMFLRVISIKESALGPDHLSIATNLNNLGTLYRRRGDTIRAEAMYERALAIRERALGPDHADVATVLLNIAALRFYSGDYAGAAASDERALAIREKHLGPDHPLVAQSLEGLASTCIEAGNLERAEPLVRRAIQIYEARLGSESINVAEALEVLSRIHLARDEVSEARAALERASEIAEKNSANDQQNFSGLLLRMGSVLALQGEYASSESHLQRSLELREKLSGPDSHYVGRVHTALAEMYVLKGDNAQAVHHQHSAARIYERSIDLNLSVGPEHQKLSYMKLISDDLNLTLGLSADPQRNDESSRTLAASVLIQRKGRVLDATAASLATLRQRLNPDDQRLFDDLTEVNGDLAENVLNPPDALSPDAYAKLIVGLRSKKEWLEREIGARSRGYFGPSQTVTLESVKALISHDAALLEFGIYRPLIKSATTVSSKLGDPRYVAFVIRNTGVTGSADLGPTKLIDAALDQFRAAVRDPRRKDVQPLARALDEKVMRPVRELVGAATHLLVSPDGELNLVPFEAFVDENGKSLIETYSISYLTTGRDLVRMQVSRTTRSPSTVVANPAFGEPGSGNLLEARSTPKSTRASRRRSLTNTRNLSETYFAPLSGTALEARSIKTLFPESTLLTGGSATETAVKNLSAPKILHIATHGFFLDDDNSSEAAIENPLLRSGVALAGANRRSGGTDDGMLTALEASGLDLWGTKLVVLSACDTGLGEIRNGEGVYGLRRSFVLAGAESLVMSLWPVSDYVTRELMTSYYKNLKAGMGRGEALRQVQLEMIKRPNRRHPFYWASFIQSGEWANLDGKR